MSNRIYSYGRQTIEEDDVASVEEVLRSRFLTQGPIVADFENALAIRTGARKVSATCNGTAALHLAGLSLGWKGGDIVITSPLTFVASANCILYAGAIADFVDIDPDFHTIDPNKLEEKLSLMTKSGKRIKAVVAVDYAGLPCDWDALKALSRRYEFQLVNDSCHSLGAKYKDDDHYAVKYADIVCLSFHPVKHITTGEGGATLSNNDELDARIKLLRTHGLAKSEKSLTNSDGPWYYEMLDLGFNYRITDFQCALGKNQLSKLDRFLTQRRGIADFYNNIFAGDDRLEIVRVPKGSVHSYHIYPLQVRFEKLRRTKREIFSALANKGIGCQVHYIPVHLQPYYQMRFGFKKGDFPIAERFYESEISIPIYPGLETEDLQYITKALLEELE